MLATSRPFVLCLSFLAASLTGWGCDEARPSSSNTAAAPASVVQHVDADGAAALVAKGGVRVLDVRTPAEFSAGHIEGAINININDPSFAAKASALPKDTPIVVHCAAGAPGGRSERAVEALGKGADHKLVHLDGGYRSWAAAGHKVVSPSAK